MMEPRFSVVTPSLNQVQYLEETIQSVLGQRYEDLEYTVMDAGSEDGSDVVIKKYESALSSWVSEPDDGQADALNRAFEDSTGELLAWIASDDYYLPGALGFAASKLDPERPQLLFGNCIHIFDGTGRAFGSDVVARHRESRIQHQDYIIEPSSFMTRKAWEITGPYDTSLNFAFDWDWFIRAEAAGVEFVSSERLLSVYRLHEAHKTGTGGDLRLSELEGIYRRYSGHQYARLFRTLRSKHIRKTVLRRAVPRLHPFLREVNVIPLLFPGATRLFSAREVLDVLSMGE